MKILRPNLSSTTDYTLESHGLMSPSDVSGVVAELHAASSQNSGIKMITMETAEANITKTIRIVRISDGHILHECHFRHKKTAKTKAKSLTLAFSVVPGSSIVTSKTGQQNREWATYECKIGETAFTNARIEIKVAGRNGSIPGKITISGDSSSSFGGDGQSVLEFSGNGVLEFEFPVSLVTPTVDPVAVAKQNTDDAWAAYSGSSLTAIYGADPFASTADFGQAIGVYYGYNWDIENLAGCFATTVHNTVPSLDAAQLFDDCIVALGATSGSLTYNSGNDYCTT